MNKLLLLVLLVGLVGCAEDHYKLDAKGNCHDGDSGQFVPKEWCEK